MATQNEVPIIGDIDVGDMFFNASAKNVQGLPLVGTNTRDDNFGIFNG